MSPEEKEKLIRAAEARADIREKLRNDPRAAAAELGITLSDEDLQRLREGDAEDDYDERIFVIAVTSASRAKKKPRKEEPEKKD